ncbi:hypothetical protein BWI93_14635 [Siphonobacter sp. BAB-5385]|nr:hypothetical protein BWI93_14635 [Siphonobacter sp. BAB-5385]
MFGFRYRITDAKGEFHDDGIDPVTDRLMNKEIRLKGMYYGSAAEQVSEIQKFVAGAYPGFNMYSGHFHANVYFRTEAQWNHQRWNEEYDHTVPNQTFTQDQMDNSIDRVIYETYRTGNSIETRTLIRILLCTQRFSDILSPSFSYKDEDIMRDENGNWHDQRTEETYLTKIPSYTSTRALNYQKEAALKFCRRYRKAINDGTIHGISFWNSEAGENNWTARYHDAQREMRPFIADFSEINRNAFIAFLQARFGTIQQLNAKLGTSIPNYSLSTFGPNLLINDGEGSNRKMQAIFQWWSMWTHATYNNDIQEYIYDNLNITRSKLFWFDVGSLINGEANGMKAYHWKLRTDISTRFIVVKSNNITEFDGDIWGIHQIASASRRAGAMPVMEPSPSLYYFQVSTSEHLIDVVRKLNAVGMGLSAFTPQDANFWPHVAGAVNLSTPIGTSKGNDLINGNTVTFKYNFEDLFLTGDWRNSIEYRLQSGWKALKDANPNVLISIEIDDSNLKSWFNNPLPGENQGGGGGETGITEIQPLSNVALTSVPTYSLPAGAINMLADAVPWDTQVDYVRRGMNNFVHPTRLWSERGGEYHAQWNPGGITEAQFREALATYNLPAGIGLYRMMYDNAIADIWPPGQAMPSSQQALNERFEGFIVGFLNTLGWDNHPGILDVDFESAQYFTWGGTKAQADAIKYLLSRHSNIRVQAYASAHNNLSGAGDGSASNPLGHISTAERFRLFKEAGVTVFQGTIPYFHVPSFFWTDPSHEPSVIGAGKMYQNHADYAKKSLHPIVAKLGWTDGYFESIPAGHQPANIEWAMGVYEGGDDGGPRQYDNEGNWISGLNWPEVGGWISESLAVWGMVTGSYRWGGGLYNWSDGRPRKASQDYMEAGKWRAYQYNRFIHSSTVYNIKLEHSLDGGNTWQTDDRPGQNLLQEHTNPKPYIRGAFRSGELLVVAVAGQPFHVNGQSQPVLIRYGGKQFSKTLQSQKVHSFTVNI